MASNQFGSASVVVYLALFGVFASPILGLRASPSASSDKVSLALYYESLCPYSANFIINYLAGIFDNGLIDIVDLKLVPWGNAKFKDNSTFACQHGPSECLLNTVEACAISVWPELEEHFAFINCVETLVYDHKFPEWETCFKKLALNAAALSSCYISGYGTELELKYAAETGSLVPPHEYVPWVVVDGQPLYEDYENFVSYVCKAYNGSSVPSACDDMPFSSMLKDKSGNHPGLVSDPEEDAAASTPTLLKSFKSGLENRAREMLKRAII